MFNKQQLCDIEDRIEKLESTPPPEPHDCATQGEVEKLEGKLHDLTLAVAEGIESVTRKERRISATLARARKGLKSKGYEDPGLEAEADELQPVDGAGGEEQGMPALREALAQAPVEASTIPGVTLEEIKRYRGLI